MRSVFFVAVLAASVSSPVVRAETAGDILAQLKSTSKDLADLDAKIAANHSKTEANAATERRLVDEYTRDIKPLEDQQAARYATQQSADAAAEAKKAAYASDCPENFPSERQQACDAEYADYDASYKTYEQATTDFNTAAAAYHQLYDPFDDRRKAALQTESDLAAEAKQLETDRSSRTVQMQFLEARLKMAKLDQKSSGCLGLKTNEAVVNCLSKQWDGTQKTNLYIPDPPQDLTQEQVIERYKNSGKPTGPQTVKTKEPPPPSTSK